MARHRFLDQDRSEIRQLAAPLSAGGFMLCPVAVQQWVGGAVPWQERIYAMALAEARAVVQPSLLERLAANLQN